MNHLFVGLLTLVATTSVWAQYDAQPLFVQYVSANGKPTPELLAEKRRLVFPLWKERFPFIDVMKDADTVLAQGFILDTTNYVLDGPLATFYSNGRLNGTARYLNGKKDGQWVDFYQTGDTSRIRLYEQDSALTSVCLERDHSIIHTGFDCGEVEAIPLNMDDFRKRIAYPPTLREAGIRKGNVVLSVLVSTEGVIKRHLVLRQAHPAFTNAVVSRLYMLRFRPKMYHFKPVPVWFTIPFKFELVGMTTTRITSAFD